MKLGAILPHTLLFGGVKRYLELGNALIRRGHEFTIFTPEGQRPSWFQFLGTVKKIDHCREPLDALFLSEEQFLKQLLRSAAKLKIFYVINKNKALSKIACHKEITFFANSTTTFKRIRSATGLEPIKAFGGVNMDDFPPRKSTCPSNQFCVLTYGRLMRSKGVELVVSACELAYKKAIPIKLFLFDTPTSNRDEALRRIKGLKIQCPFEFILDHPPKRNYELFNSAHIFVSAERKAGWANTAAEAMAAGVAVIATKEGTEDFLLDGITGLLVRRKRICIYRAIERLYRSAQLREILASNGHTIIKRYSWENLAASIEQFIFNSLKKC